MGTTPYGGFLKGWLCICRTFLGKPVCKGKWGDNIVNFFSTYTCLNNSWNVVDMMLSTYKYLTAELLHYIYTHLSGWTVTKFSSFVVLHLTNTGKLQSFLVQLVFLWKFFRERCIPSDFSGPIRNSSFSSPSKWVSKWWWNMIFAKLVAP